MYPNTSHEGKHSQNHASTSSRSRLCGIAFSLFVVAATMPSSEARAQAGKKFDTAEEAFRAGVAYLSLGEEAKSQEPLEQALRLAPDDKYRIKVYEALIPSYTLLPEIDKKVEALEFLIAKSDSAAKRSLARRSLLSFVHQRGKTDVIVTRYEDRLKKDGKDLTALYVLSEIYATLKPNAKRGAEVMEKLAAVMKDQGTELELGATAGLAGQYVKSGKFKEGAELYEKIADRDPKLAAWHWKEAAQAWLKAKENDKALAAAKASDGTDGEKRNDQLEHFWHRQLGEIFMATNEPKLAIPHFEKAIEKTKIDGYIKDCQKKLAEARAKAGQ